MPNVNSISSALSLQQPLLEMRGISKSFPGVQALDQVDLTSYRGEVLALVGENGAGKSTLIKILSGAHQADRGSIRLDGEHVKIGSPSDAIEMGVAVIYQELNLVPALSAADNIFLGRELAKFGMIASRRQHVLAKQLLQRIGLHLDPQVPCSDLTIAQQQGVEIAKALSLDARLLVMDEPSAVLTPRELHGLYEVVRELTSQGLGIIYITHRLEEISELADRVMVLRDGQQVAEYDSAQVSRAELIEAMVGRSVTEEFPDRGHRPGRVRLQASGLTRRPAVRNVSLEVRGGEVLGITGLVGAGRSEVARLLFGADKRESGTITLDGRKCKINGPRDAIAQGIGLLPEDRKAQGLIPRHSVRNNFSLPNLAAFSRWGWIDRRRESDALGDKVKKLNIRLAQYEQAVSELSGGNQQKIVLAKWLEKNCEVVIFDEPTRGIDVGAKLEIYELINRLCAQGKAIVMISSELPEVIGMADRILVMRHGEIAGEFDDTRQVTQQQIMNMAVS